MAKTVLLLAYHFPPIGGPTGERALNEVVHLPAYDYEPVVLTGGFDADFWAPLDSASHERLPQGIRIERVAVPPTDPRRARAERLLGLPSSFGHRFAEAASRIARELRGRVDVMICLFGPYDLAEAAIRVARELDVPWVADLQDPWALDEMWLYPSALHRLQDRQRMHRVLRAASVVVMNTDEAARRVRSAFSDLDVSRVHAIPNGFSATDFTDSEPRRDDTDIFRIVHTGSMHTQFGLRQRRTARLRTLLGGMPVPGVDFLTRSHVYLLEALAGLSRRDASLASRLQVHLVGPLTNADWMVVERSPVEVRAHGFLPHIETARMIRSADLLFLPMHALPSGVRAGIVPTKTYEYAASGRPILAAVPEGDARDLLRKLGTATVVDPADVSGMERAVAGSYGRWHRGERPPEVNREVVARFEYGNIIREIACALDEAVERR